MPSNTLIRSWVRSKADERAVDAGCYFDMEAADRVRKFFSRVLRHSKGQFAGKNFELLDWQWQDIVAPLFGWKRADGFRRYRKATIWISKKQGKSTLASGFILYGLVADNEQGAEVYGAAADRNQAGIIFNEVDAMVSQSPALSKLLDSQKTVRRYSYQAKHSFYQVLSKDSRKTGHGVNAHVCVIDELHVVNRELYDTLRYAGAARRQPLLIEISTAGNDKTSLGYQRYCYAKRLLKGEQEDLETLAVVYEAESNDKWEDPEQWRRANPSLGTTVSLDSFRGDFNEAKNGSPADQAAFKQLRLNIWQDSLFSWMPPEAWDACVADLVLASMIGRPCWGGLDLASRIDLCAWAMIFELDEGVYALFLRFWAPREADSRRQKANNAQLAPWAESGYVSLTEGSTTNYDVIEEQIKEDCDRFGVREVAVDPWNAQHVINHLRAYGIKMVEFAQNVRNYNDPFKEFEKLILAGKIKHEGNPVMKLMVVSTIAKKDAMGYIRPDKESSTEHIDGVTAAVMALGRAMLKSDDSASVYDNDGIKFI